MERDRTVAEVIAACLARHGVERLFSQSLPSALVLACEDLGIRQYTYRTENAGGAMADGYARISHKVGVVTAQNGPAATLLVPPLAEALKSSVPVVALVQEVDRPTMDRNAFQELDHIALFQGCTKWVRRLTDVAVIPFTLFLKGNSTFSLIGTMGGYLGALVLTPLLTLGLLGAGFIDPGKLVLILLELILLPLILSRILLRTGIAWRIEPIKGAITNWSFFIICYTIVGLNREVFFTQPVTLLPVVIIALASTFFLGWAIEKVGQAVRIEPSKLTSLVLLGTLKNYGLAGGLALALFSEKTALPATVSSVFLVVYIIRLHGS